MAHTEAAEGAGTKQTFHSLSHNSTGKHYDLMLHRTVAKKKV